MIAKETKALIKAVLMMHRAFLVGKPCEFVKQGWERMSHPRIGDLVVETSTGLEPRAGCFGRLVKVFKCPKRGRLWVIESIEDRTLTTWENANFIAIPDYLEWPEERVNIFWPHCRALSADQAEQPIDY